MEVFNALCLFLLLMVVAIAGLVGCSAWLRHALERADPWPYRSPPLERSMRQVHESVSR